MSVIQRPIKTHGTREYVQEVAIDPMDTIKAAEMDGDLDTMYADYDGNITTANIAANAGILGTQLSPTANILGSQLAAAANILGSQLSPTAGITDGQLAAGAAVHADQTVNPTAGVIVAGGGEQPVATLPSMTTRGGTVLLIGTASLVWNGTGVATVITRIYRDVTVLQTVETDIANSNAGTISVTIPTPNHVDMSAPAGPHVYKFTLEVQTNGSVTTSGAGAGTWTAAELA